MTTIAIMNVVTIEFDCAVGVVVIAIVSTVLDGTLPLTAQLPLH